MKPEPRATYRLQLRPDFGFQQVSEILSYLVDLGISHLYFSPYLQPAAGSTHGYDVVDPTRINQELGGAEAHACLCEKLLDVGLEQVIDLVPNHMAIVGSQNPWWWDVLENGQASRYATYFDIDWETPGERWPDKILLPVLGDHYGRILEDGQLRLSNHQTAFVLHYHEHQFPVDPASLARLLADAAQACGSELLGFLAESHKRLPRPVLDAREGIDRRHRDKVILTELLEKLCADDPGVKAAIQAEVDRTNRDPDLMDHFLEQQNYRLAFWRTASRDLGYRRFFDINSLVGMRVEDHEVFNATHALALGWVEKGWVHGLRVDHPDGLRDPVEYFQRLRRACPNAWIVTEKILASSEQLRPDWPVDGSTGYDFLSLADGLFIDPRGERPLTELYAEFSGETTDFPTLVLTCKRQVLDEALDSDLSRLTNLFVAICERHRRHRDFTRHDLREALHETAACFPVYRTYVRGATGQVTDEDLGYITTAISRAREERRDLDPELFDFLGEILLLRIGGALESELAMRFQQLTGPAMAKGVEDTAFYRFHRLASLNEVGGDPNRFGTAPSFFHQACRTAQTKHPRRLLTSSTHDTKRSEDVRSRLALISEIPDRWREAVCRWADHNGRHRRGTVPDPATEYLFYQTLVGAWPIDIERIAAYMEKAVREAKVQTSWTRIDADYETGLLEFIQNVLADETFRGDLNGFVAELVAPGRLNSLALTLLKLSAPGVPDIYQGMELWNLSLVDPDNRRPVDFTRRRRLLDELPALSVEEIMHRMDQGLPKLWLIRQVLELRRNCPGPFGPKGTYIPLVAKGEKADHVLAFKRGGRVIAIIPRLVWRWGGGWDDTTLDLPRGTWHNVLTGESWPTGPARLSEMLARFPVGLLVLEEL